MAVPSLWFLRLVCQAKPERPRSANENGRLAPAVPSGNSKDHALRSMRGNGVRLIASAPSPIRALRQRCNDEEGGILPAAALGREHPAVARMRPQRPDKNRHEGQDHSPGIEAEHDQDAADEFGGKDGIGEYARQAEAFEEARRAR